MADDKEYGAKKRPPALIEIDESDFDEMDPESGLETTE